MGCAIYCGPYTASDMKNLTDAERRMRIALLEADQSVEQLAQAICLTRDSTYNIVRGGRCGAGTKQRITNFLNAEIWPGIAPSPQIRFEAGTTLVFSNPKQAREFAAVIGEGGERRDRYIRISTDLQLFVNPPAADKAQPVGKAGNPIDIWCGEAPPDSPFPPNEKIPARQRRRQGHTAKAKRTSKPAAATGRPAPATRSRE